MKDRESKQNIRYQIAEFQVATVCLFVLSIAFNLIFANLYIEEKNNFIDMQEEYEKKLLYAEKTRDNAVQELGRMAIQVANEKANMEVQTLAYDEVSKYEYLGEFTVTAYCCELYEHICGTGDGLTASGLELKPGMVAVDPDVIPLGSTIIIDGIPYLATDTGGAIKGNRIDIAVPTHQEALELGIQTSNVWIVNEK